MKASPSPVHETPATPSIAKVPAPIDPRTGTILAASDSFANWAGYPFRTRLVERISLPVAVCNDVDSFLIGESSFGVVKGRDNCLAVMLGTGVGGALLLNGGVVQGPRGAAGEIDPAHQAGVPRSGGDDGVPPLAGEPDQLTAAVGAAGLPADQTALLHPGELVGQPGALPVHRIGQGHHPHRVPLGLGQADQYLEVLEGEIGVAGELAVQQHRKSVGDVEPESPDALLMVVKPRGVLSHVAHPLSWRRSGIISDLSG